MLLLLGGVNQDSLLVTFPVVCALLLLLLGAFLVLFGLLPPLGFGRKHVLAVALPSNLPHQVNLAHAFPKTLLQAVAKALALGSAASQLHDKFGSRRGGFATLAGQGFCILLVGRWVSVPGADAEGKHVALAVQTLNPADGTQR